MYLPLYKVADTPFHIQVAVIVIAKKFKASWVHSRKLREFSGMRNDTLRRPECLKG